MTRRQQDGGSVDLPRRQVSHTGMLFDSVSLALVFDALTHPGPARAARIPASVCHRQFAAGIDRAAAQRELHAGDAFAVTGFISAKQLTAEPALPRYATRPAPAPKAILLIGGHKAGPNTQVTFRALGAAEGQRWPLPFATITVAGRRVATDAQGRATFRLTLRGARLRVRLTAPGLGSLTGWLR